jgi:hypothetical protein
MISEHHSKELQRARHELAKAQAALSEAMYTEAPIGMVAQYSNLFAAMNKLLDASLHALDAMNEVVTDAPTIPADLPRPRFLWEGIRFEGNESWQQLMLEWDDATDTQEAPSVGDVE